MFGEAGPLKMFAASILLLFLIPKASYSQTCGLPLPSATEIATLIACGDGCNVTEIHPTCLAVASRDRYSQVSLIANASNTSSGVVRAVRIQLSCFNLSWVLENEQPLNDADAFTLPTRRDCVDCMSVDTRTNCTRKCG